MLRVLKFYQRNYRIPLDSLGAVIARLVGGVHWDELQRSRFGNRGEQGLAQVLTSLLREVDPLVDSDAIGHVDTVHCTHGVPVEECALCLQKAPGEAAA
jgi:hypothetical protein